MRLIALGVVIATAWWATMVESDGRARTAHALAAEAQALLLQPELAG